MKYYILSFLALILIIVAIAAIKIATEKPNERPRFAPQPNQSSNPYNLTR
jgi:hypothetical protein